MDDSLTPVAQSVPEGASIVSELLSFESFFDREARTQFRRLYAVTGDAGEAEEIMQDAFLAPDPVPSADIDEQQDVVVSRTPLLVRRELEDEPDLWVLNIDATGLYQVTHSPAEYTGYRWLPPNE
jgi:hypothetical protein